MNAREQLIEAIAQRFWDTRAEWFNYFESELDQESAATIVLQALADLGAVVLMPVKAKEVPTGASVCLHPVGITNSWSPDLLKGQGDPGFNVDPEVTLYVKPLESEQS
jgi:hypothetical protein